MKIAVVFLLLLNGAAGLAQRGSDMQVEYQAFFDTDSPMKMFTTLYISGNVAVYQEKLSGKEEWKEKAKPDNNPPGTVVSVSGGIPEDNYYRIDRSKKEVLFYDDIMRNKFLVVDTYPGLQWTVTDETKTVAGLTCIKAATNFRGREWIAWFAPEIPLAFGPWKLQGLPGLILEAYDSTNKYTMKAVKIEYKKDNMVAKDFTSFFKTTNSKPVAYKKFLADREEAQSNAHNEMATKMAAYGATITMDTVPRSGEELKYEWEE